MSLKQKAVSGVKWSSASTGSVVLLQFLSLAVLSRVLSPADFGLMGMIMVVIGFAQTFADMGISNAIIQRRDATRNQLSSLYWLNVLTGTTIAAIVCLCTPLIVRLYHEPRLENILYWTSVTFLITPFGQQFQILLQKHLKFHRLAKIEIATATVGSIVSIATAFLGFGVYALVCGQLTSCFAKTILLLAVGWRDWSPGFHFARSDVKGYVSFGLYQMGERTINYFNSNLDYLLIGSMLGAKALGYYTLAYNLIIRPSLTINPVITKVAFPIFSEIQKDAERIKRGYLKVLQLLSLVNFPLMAGLAATAPLAIPIVFGEQWAPSVPLVQILTIVGLLRSTGNPIGSLLLAKGRADLGFVWNLGLVTTQIPGLYVGAKMGGAIGVAIAFACLMAIYSVFNYLVLIRSLLGPCLRRYVGSMWPSLWISILMFCVVVVVGVSLQNTSGHLAFAIQILSGTATYLGLVFYTDRSLINEIKGFVLQKA